MTDVTINDLAEVTTIASGDFVAIWRTANGDTRKISRTNLQGGYLTGGGTLATGGYTLTVPKTGTAVVGTGTAGRVAEWVTDTNTVQASTLAKTGAGVLTLSASSTAALTVTGTSAIAGTLSAAGFTLTAAATGTAALLGTTQSFTGFNSFNAGMGSGRTTATISSGAITATSNNMRIDTEGAASTDDLTTINGGGDGQILFLYTTSASRDVVVKHGAGNIYLNGGADVTLNTTRNVVMLVYLSSLPVWIGFAFALNN